MTNAKANWLCFALPITVCSLASASTVTGHSPPAFASIFLLSARPAGSSLRRPSPAGYCLPQTAGLPKTERGPISTSTPSSVCHRTRRFLGKNNPFLLTRRRPQRSRPFSRGHGVQRQPAPGRACRLHGHQPQLPVFALLSLISRNSPRDVVATPLDRRATRRLYLRVGRNSATYQAVEINAAKNHSFDSFTRL